MEHYSLLNLALEEYAYYVSNIFVKLIDLSQKSLVDDFIVHYLQPTCKFLEDQIQNNLPCNLSSKVTEIVLKLMVKVLNHLECYNIRSDEEETINFITEIGVHVACATSHHSISYFRSPKITENYRNLRIFDFVGLYIEEMLKKTQTFKELHFDKIRLSGSVPPLNYLECWISRSTTDEILSVLAESSKNLNFLDLSGSYCCLSDNSIDSILKFYNLRHLELIYTSISIEGIERLIRGLKISKDNFPLKRKLTHFGVIMQPSYAYLIPEYLPQLTVLNLHLLTVIDLIPLKEMKLLKSLTVTTGMNQNMFACVETLIQEIGHSLIELKLDMMYVDLKTISDCCPDLKMLSLKCIFDLSEYVTLKFESVHDLEVSALQNSLSNLLPEFLSQFSNLKRLKLWLKLDHPEDISSLDNLLHSLKKAHFEEMSLVSHFNCITIKFHRGHVVITSDLGYSVTVCLSELEEIIVEALQNGIQNLSRKYRIFSS